MKTPKTIYKKIGLKYSYLQRTDDKTTLFNWFSFYPFEKHLKVHTYKFFV